MWGFVQENLPALKDAETALLTDLENAVASCRHDDLNLVSDSIPPDQLSRRSGHICPGKPIEQNNK